MTKSYPNLLAFFLASSQANTPTNLFYESSNLTSPKKLISSLAKFGFTFKSAETFPIIVLLNLYLPKFDLGNILNIFNIILYFFE